MTSSFITRYAEFVRMVVRHQPSRLLPTLAAVSSKQSLETYRPDRGEQLHPWIIAAIARESIAWQKGRKDRRVDDHVLYELSYYYSSLRDPFLDEHGTEDSLTSFLIRVAYEQFPHQHSLFEDTARVLPLLDPRPEHLPARALEVVSSAAWKGLLGTELGNFVRAGNLFSTGAWVNGGLFRPDWLTQSNFDEIRQCVPLDETLAIFNGLFAASWSDARESARRGRQKKDDLRKYDFNSLAAKPFVEFQNGSFYAPQAGFVSRRVSPASLYFEGLAAWGERFSRDFGHLLESYVGRHLALLEGLGCTVYSEFEYQTGAKSCDYIVETTSHAILVEVKAARVAMPGRIDFAGYWEDIERDVGKAFTQISRSAALIESEHSGFPESLHSKQLRGLVVTAEPHYLVNSAPVRTRLQSPQCATSVLSVGELERLLEHALGAMNSDALVRITNVDPNGLPNVDEEFKSIQKEYKRERNPVLEDGWKRGEWQFPEDP